MRRFIARIVFFGCLLLLYISVSEFFMTQITNNKPRLKGLIGSHLYQYGDLFGLSFLKDFKVRKIDYVDKPLHVDQLPRDLSLYMICDSYVFGPFEGKSDYFSRVKDFHILKLKDPQWNPPKFNPKNKNILVFEIVLRNVYNQMNMKNITDKSNFSNLSALPTNSISGSSVPIQTTPPESFNLLDDVRKWMSSVNQKVMRTLYHKNIETHLELIMFDFNFLLPLKVWKAEWFFKYFNRINGAVVLSKDRKFLFMENTVDPKYKGSSNYPISDAEIEEQVNQINQLNDFFKSKGFDQVLFSIIPNPYDLVSSQEFGQNNQIKRVLASKNLKAKLFDISPHLAVNAQNNFFPSDSHWNANGSKIWLTEFNKYLNSIPH
ncbi:hypothetical protein V7S76_03700 [Aquirufa sp. ROCK2-A2]